MKVDVFISYRRGPAAGDDGDVHRLAETLSRKLRLRSVYLDIKSKATGRGIRHDIKQSLRHGGVVVVVINATWAGAVERLHDPEDFVRLEIESALEADLNVLPIVLPGARLPRKTELPRELQNLLDRQATLLHNTETSESDFEDFATVVRASLPARSLQWVSNVAESHAANSVFGLLILGGALLFVSHGIGIHRLAMLLPVKAALGARASEWVTIVREVGVLMAWNWTLVLLIVNPVMAYLATTTLKEAKALLVTLGHNRMIHYADTAGRTSPITARRLWDEVARPSSMWLQAFVVIAITLGTYQWWIYAGQWVRKGFELTPFMQVSTGPDWHVGWALGTPGLDDAAGAISAFALVMYLAYGIGTAITFSYYAFLFNFSSTMSHLATSASSMASAVLRLNTDDRESGGLAAFRRIQEKHAAFCYWSVFGVYVMALRNAYLPQVCRIPEPVMEYLGGDAATALEQCSTMPKFVTNIGWSARYFVETVIAGAPDLGILFFTYSEQNHFIFGSMLYGLLIASFFYLISIRMKSVVANAQLNTATSAGAELLRSLGGESWRVLAVLVFGSLSTVFLNLGPFAVVFALSVSLIQRSVLRLRQARTT